MPQQLTKMKLDEVSLVDRGADTDAWVVLKKRDEPVSKKCVLGHNDISKCEFIKSGSCTNKNCTVRMSDMEKAAPAGLQFNIGFKEEGGSEIQSVVFDASKWDEEKAKAWLKEHDMASGKVDQTKNTLRFRQHDPEDYVRFRMITPGAQVSKALKAKDSWSSMQSKVDMALREKFEERAADGHPRHNSYVYVRDLFKDAAIFEQDGMVYRADYEIDYSAEGEPTVRFGDKVPQQVVYQDVQKAEDVEEKKPPEVPAELLFKLGRLQADTTLLHRRVSKLRRPRRRV
jgi:hypothetical protein